MRAVERHELEPMIASVVYRGPDEEGMALQPGVGLAFRRLAIVDLERGQQPMSTPDGRLTLVCNGEIYNHAELRELLTAKGHAFRTASDSEVILHGYAEWGAACAERLRGIFAFALWDAPRRQLQLCRDRSGVKPLYLQLQDGELAFASEAKALLCRSGGAKGLDLLACFGPPEPDVLLDPSPFAEVTQLGAGCTLTFTADGDLRPRRYWRYSPSSELGASAAEEATIAQYRDELLRVVPMELMSDVPIGVCLSGGLDSSVVAAVAGQHVDRLPAFTTVCARSDDPWFAYGVVRSAGLDPHFISFVPEELLELLPLVAWGAEGAFDLGFVSRYQLAAAARERGLKVLLSAQGVDELMGGYDRSYAGLVRAAERAVAAERLLHSGWRDVASALRHRSAVDHRDGALQVSNVVKRLELEHAELAHYLLRFEDRMGMLASVEIRVPLLDHRLVELCAKVPATARRTLFGDKRLLREAARGLVPDTSRLRRKFAFNGNLPPVTQVLARAGRRVEASEWLSEQAIRDKGYFDPREVTRFQRAGNYRVLDAVLIVHLLDELFVSSFEPTRFASSPSPPAPEITVDESWMPVETVRISSGKGLRSTDTPWVPHEIVSIGYLQSVDQAASDRETEPVLLAVRFNDGREVLTPAPEGLDVSTVVAFVRQADGNKTYASLADLLGTSVETVLAVGRFAIEYGLVRHDPAPGPS